MPIYHIFKTPSENQYRGTGDVIAAVRGRSVVSIRYLRDFRFSRLALPKWIQAAIHECPALLDEGIQLGNIRSHHWSNIYNNVRHIEDFPEQLKKYRPREIAEHVIAELTNAKRCQYQQFKERTEAQLGTIGEVFEGLCTSGVFIANNPYLDAAA